MESSTSRKLVKSYVFNKCLKEKYKYQLNNISGIILSLHLADKRSSFPEYLIAVEGSPSKINQRGKRAYITLDDSKDSSRHSK